MVDSELITKATANLHAETEEEINEKEPENEEEILAQHQVSNK